MSGAAEGCCRPPDRLITFPPQALIKRRLENRPKRSSSSQVSPLGLSKGSRYLTSSEAELGNRVNKRIKTILWLFSRHHGSRESVSIPISALGSLDLSSDSSTVIRPVHSSILGEKYCFEVELVLFRAF